MPCCTRTRTSFRSITAAMAKAASARLRDLGATPIASDSLVRQKICARCPMHVVHSGIAYCGTPFLRKIVRDPVLDGCGCPIKDKARSPDEHCPVDARYQPPITAPSCNCKWCNTGTPSSI